MLPCERTMSFYDLIGLLFGCHRRPDRSFFFNGKQFPVCARCTGMGIGYIAGIINAILNHAIAHYWYLPLLIPMLLDGIVQRCTSYESTNLRRVLTGFLGGVAVINMLICIHLGTVKLAYAFLEAFSK